MDRQAIRRRLFVFIVLLTNSVIWFLMSLPAALDDGHAESRIYLFTLLMGGANFVASFMVMWGFRFPGKRGLR